MLKNKIINEGFSSWIESNGIEKDNIIPLDFENFITDLIEEKNQTKDLKIYIQNRASGLNQSNEFTFKKFYWEVVKKINE